MNDFGRDDKHRTGGNRVGPWSPASKRPLCAKSGHRSVLLLVWLLAFGAKAVDQLRRADGMCSVSFPPFNQSNT